ncbi:uncharacterized protein LOC126419110 [Schistocerca serialis cubense]|uniref:uncharacterized protein LOC126419110 n=1 Tax=Schistocerca serialis cubense TaxID=2023355 RepID=UPI00214E1F93|nr:uncharacterized protein LOC126419110 [Schistocerca serialis cubense]
MREAGRRAVDAAAGGCLCLLRPVLRPPPPPPPPPPPHRTPNSRSRADRRSARAPPPPQPPPVSTPTYASRRRHLCRARSAARTRTDLAHAFYVQQPLAGRRPAEPAGSGEAAAADRPPQTTAGLPVLGGLAPARDRPLSSDVSRAARRLEPGLRISGGGVCAPAAARLLATGRAHQGLLTRD